MYKLIKVAKGCLTQDKVRNALFLTYRWQMMADTSGGAHGFNPGGGAALVSGSLLVSIAALLGFRRHAVAS